MCTSWLPSIKRPNVVTSATRLCRMIEPVPEVLHTVARRSPRWSDSDATHTGHTLHATSTRSTGDWIPWSPSSLGYLGRVTMGTPQTNETVSDFQASKRRIDEALDFLRGQLVRLAFLNFQLNFLSFKLSGRNKNLPLPCKFFVLFCFVL